MREIKFRGLSVNGKDWHIGNLSIIDTDLSSAVKRGHYISNSIGLPFAYQVRPETVGEYTGFKDKNGKEIYEGNTVKVDVDITIGRKRILSKNVPVVLNEGRWEADGWSLFDHCKYNRVEVIDATGVNRQDDEMKCEVCGHFLGDSTVATCDCGKYRW